MGLPEVRGSPVCGEITPALSLQRVEAQEAVCLPSGLLLPAGVGIGACATELQKDPHKPSRKLQGDRSAEACSEASRSLSHFYCPGLRSGSRSGSR